MKSIELEALKRISSNGQQFTKKSSLNKVKKMINLYKKPLFCTWIGKTVFACEPREYSGG